MPVIKVSAQEENGIRTAYGKIAVAVENELRRILETIGLDIKPDMPGDVIQAQMKVRGIEIFHATFDKSPKFNGWHIYQNKELVLIVCDPKLDPKNRNRIVIERILPPDA